MARYYDGERWVSNEDQENAVDIQPLTYQAQGYLPSSGWTGNMVDWNTVSGANGQRFNSEQEYFDWLYGPGGTYETINGEKYYLPPGGIGSAGSFLPGRSPMQMNPPDSMLGQLTLAGLVALAGAGLTGGLPGTENVFSGIGSGFTDAASVGDAFNGVSVGSDGLLSGPVSFGDVASAGELGSGTFNLGSGGASAVSDAGGLLGSGTAGVPGASSVFPVNPLDYASVDAFPPISSPPTNLVNYVTQGTGASTPPPIPGAEVSGNGVGLTEAAQAGTQAATATSSALARIMDGTATAADYLSVGGNVLGPLLGVAGANSMQGDFNDIANRMLNEGQWARDKFKSTFDAGYSMADQPDFMNALNIGADAAARATSARSGNPVDNPGAYAEMQKYISGSLALPQLNTTRSQLINAGGIGFDQAGQAQGAAAQAGGGMYNALGYGLGQLTQPDNPFKGLLDQYKNLNSGRFF